MAVRRKRPPSWRPLLFRVAGMFYCCSDFACIGVMAITVKSSEMDDDIVVRALNPSVIGQCAGEASVERPGPLSSETRDDLRFCNLDQIGHHA